MLLCCAVQAELLKYHGSGRGRGAGVQLTPAVVSRLFQENITYRQPPPARMDFKAFLDLALALESRDHPQSLRVSE